MTTWKRILTLMLAVLMTLSVLAACGGSNAETAQTPAETNPVTEPVAPTDAIAPEPAQRLTTIKSAALYKSCKTLDNINGIAKMSVAFKTEP